MIIAVEGFHPHKQQMVEDACELLSIPLIKPIYTTEEILSLCKSSDVLVLFSEGLCRLWQALIMMHECCISSWSAFEVLSLCYEFTDSRYLRGVEFIIRDTLTTTPIIAVVLRCHNSDYSQRTNNLAQILDKFGVDYEVIDVLSTEESELGHYTYLLARTLRKFVHQS